MFGVFNPYSYEMKMFEAVEGLFKYITRIENEKMLEDHKYFEHTAWRFIIFSRQDVRDLFEKMKKEDITEELRQAYEQELELIEICHGDYQKPARVPLTVDINLEALKMDWCRAYCEAHNFYFAEEP